MRCALCLTLADEPTEVRDAVTVVAGYAACEPHVDLADFIGCMDPTHGAFGLGPLLSEAAGVCRVCGKRMGVNLAEVAGPDEAGLCVACVTR